MTRIHPDMSKPAPRRPFLGRIILFLIAVLIIAGAVVLLGPAYAEENCPADRPFARTVTDYSQPVWCTLLACMGKLSCPVDASKPCVRVPHDCNSCTGPPTMTQRFNQEELDKAMQR